MSNKGLGQKIAIRFTQPLITESVSINKNAFTVTAKEKVSAFDNDLLTMTYPVLKVEKHPDNPTNTLLLTFDNFNRFKNAASDITIKYDSSKGNLAGIGGYVEDFEFDFSPLDLVKELETIKVQASSYIEFIKVTYNKRYHEEHFSVTASAQISHIDTTIVNP